MPAHNRKDLSQHGHGHGIGPVHGIPASKRIGTALVLNLTFTVIELVGGMLTNSLAILSDALHDLGDTASLGLAWRMARISSRRGDETFSYGYRRFSLLGAVVMSALLVIGGVVVVAEAIPRLLRPEATYAPGMFFLAIGGLAVNGLAALRMRGGRSLNERIVTWHFLEDVLGWAAVLVASVAMWVWDIPWLDPLLSILITLYVLWNVVRHLRETLVVFLQGVPTSIKLEDVEQAICAMPGVVGVHHTHIWSQDGEHHVLTAHVVTHPGDVSTFEEATRLRAELKTRLARFGISHATLELESDSCRGPTCSDSVPSCRGSNPNQNPGSGSASGSGSGSEPCSDIR
ncbi:cation transporter [Candidatus Bipolaricaulota bacterium]|nr:cation transporter [Candidatus Bipolaricaulota bacterium]